jgi:hypothetical protein
VGGYDSVKRFVRQLEQAHPLPFRRMESEPGQEAQVDFGQGAWVVEDGHRRRPHVLRVVLSHSRKGKIEAGIKYVQANGLAGKLFGSLDAQNVHLAHWEQTVADTRIHGTTRQQVRMHFLTVEKPKLLSDVPAASAILDRFLHHAQTIAITGRSYRFKDQTSAKEAKSAHGTDEH